MHVRSSDGLRGPQGSALEDQRPAARRARRRVPRGRRSRHVRARWCSSRTRENATQIVLGASQQSRWTHLIRGSVITNVIRASGDIDVHVISAPVGEAEDAAPTRSRRRPCAGYRAVSPRRRVLAWALAIAGPRCVTLVLAQLRDALTLPSDLLVLLLLVVVVAALRRFRPRVRVRDLGLPVRQLVSSRRRSTSSPCREGENLLALGDLPARRRGGELPRLDRVAPHGRGGPGARRGRDARPRSAARSPRRPTRFRSSSRRCRRVRSRIGRRAVALRRLRSGPCVAGVGPTVPDAPEHADLAVPLSGHDMLVVRGADLGPDDFDVLQAFAGQVADRGAAARPAGRRRARRRARSGQRAANRAPRRGVARPADAAFVDQGVGRAACCNATSTSRPTATRGAARDHRRRR